MRQVLERPRVLGEMRRVDVKQRYEREQGVVAELPTAQHVGIATAQVRDQPPRALVHVGLGVVHPPARDVEEVAVNAVAVDYVRDPSAEPIAPGVDAQIHVATPTPFMPAVAPSAPIQIE